MKQKVKLLNNLFYIVLNCYYLMSTDTLEEIESEVLLRRRWRFDDFKIDDLSDLRYEIETAFENLVQEHIPKNGFSAAHYEVIFYRGRLSRQDLLGYDLSGSFSLGSLNKHVLSKFYEGCNDLFAEVRDELGLRPGSFNLEVSVVGSNEKY